MLTYKDVLPVALKGLQEGPWKGVVDDKSILKYLGYCAEAGSLFIAEDEGKVVGFFAATFMPTHIIMGDVPCAGELAWYVLPQYRHKGHGLDLLNQFEAWAKNLGCKHLFLGKKRKGYLPMEQVHWKQV